MTHAGLSRAQVDSAARAADVKAQLAALDVKVPRWGEAVIKASPEALAEVIDSEGTTRGDVIAKKEALRAELASLA